MERSIVNLCRRIIGSRWFDAVVMTAIVLNAALLGVESHRHPVGGHDRLLDAAGQAITILFTIEIAIRLLAHGRRPDRFFRDGWNLFDFIIVAALLMPGIGGNPAILRLVRLLRVARLFELIPDLKIILHGLLHSLRPMCGVAALTVLVMYLYAVGGWLAFGEGLPDEWGDTGTAMMTMFQLLTLDDWGNVFARARDESALAVPFFVSFVLVGGFIVLNIVIAVIINSVEEARRNVLEERLERAAERAEAAGSNGAAPAPVAELAQMLRSAADELERRPGP